MADPLSFVASVISVTSLAGNVATKGYRYIKAVKDCRDDVRSLMTEVNVLCGILQRLVVLLRYNRPKSGLRNNVEDFGDDDSEADSDGSADCDSNQRSGSGMEKTNGILEPPDFIYECQRTLFEIENILNKFNGSVSPPPDTMSKQPRYTLSRLRRLEPKDLKWPLTKSKTLQLIEALERHKSTCTIALAKDSVIGIHAVLEQTKLSNRHLAELKAKQEKVLELAITQEEGTCICQYFYSYPILQASLLPASLVVLFNIHVLNSVAIADQGDGFPSTVIVYDFSDCGKYRFTCD